MCGANRCRKQQIAPRGESSQRPCFQARGRAKEGGARMRHHFFITGTDAGVGKTVLSALLCAALDTVYWKPIQTGTLEGSDRVTEKMMPHARSALFRAATRLETRTLAGFP